MPQKEVSMAENSLIMEMTEYYKGEPARIQHFMKVYAYAKLIGEMEKLDPTAEEILEIAALVHDIGIKKSEEIYGDSKGPHQEELGPAIAEKMLAHLGYEEKVIQRVSYLVGHHHTYNQIEGLDYQILVEADFLVNLYEEQATESAIQTAYKKIFQTETGKKLCRTMFHFATPD